MLSIKKMPAGIVFLCGKKPVYILRIFAGRCWLKQDGAFDSGFFDMLMTGMAIFPGSKNQDGHALRVLGDGSDDPIRSQRKPFRFTRCFCTGRGGAPRA